VSDPHAEHKDQIRERFSQANYAEIAKFLEPAARELVDACAISAGQEVLDVACGNGNVAILAAEEGAAVVGSDITPAMLELAKVRAEEDGVDIEWVEADAEDLPFEDKRFECVTSAFGAMFAPRPEVVASEMFRVVRPGNTVGMANWTPDGFTGRMFAVCSQFVPNPEGVAPAAEWGREEVVRERFEGLAGSITAEKRIVPFAFESLEAIEDWFRQNTPSARHPGLGETELAQMVSGVRDLAQEMNAAEDGSVLIESEYLLVVAHRRG
jgi:ubiquinone/menaquinone biosynthesis C-methylase UbiE